MKLSDVNNVLIFLVLIILANIAYNIFTNKKNIETFTNGWSLNSDGQLCQPNGDCQSIGVLGTGNGKICTVGSDTLIVMILQQQVLMILVVVMLLDVWILEQQIIIQMLP